jgi:K+-transporting ATPase A subunit
MGFTMDDPYDMSGGYIQVLQILLNDPSNFGGQGVEKRITMHYVVLTYNLKSEK